jgi:hypothetical protein
MKEVVDAIVAMIGLFALIIGIYQYAKAQRWKRAEFIADRFKELDNNPGVVNALRMLDWNEREIELFPELAVPAARWQTINDQTLMKALVSEPQADKKFNEVEVKIRDCFDALLSSLDRLDNFIEAKLISGDEVKPYIQYWIEIIADPTLGRKTPELLTEMLWPYIASYGFTGVQSLCRRFGYDIRPQLRLLSGDIVFTRGKGWISRGIRFFSRRLGESRAKVNHVGVVVTAGTLEEAKIVEALATVKEHPLKTRYGTRRDEVSVFRFPNLTDEQREKIAEKAKSYVDRKYGYLRIVAHFLDWCLLGAYCFRRLLPESRYPICSWVVAAAYKSIDRDFNVAIDEASPDDIWNYVNDLRNQSVCCPVWELSTLPLADRPYLNPLPPR